MTDSMDRVPIEPQSIVTPLSKAAVFLVLKLDPSAHALTRAIEVISDIGGLTRAVGFAICTAAYRATSASGATPGIDSAARNARHNCAALLRYADLCIRHRLRAGTSCFTFVRNGPICASISNA